MSGMKRCDSAGRVHFVERQITPDHTGEILVCLSPDGHHADAHLGFLQKNRRYQVAVTITRYLGDTLVVAKKNPHLKLVTTSTNKDKSKQILNIELVAHHHGLLNEEFCLKLEGAEEPFTVTLSARVLGPGKGTPMLKSGIHLIGVENSGDTSEFSEGEALKQHADKTVGD